MNSWNTLKADTHRQYGHFSWKSLVIGFITLRTFRPVITLRLCQLTATSQNWLYWTLPVCKLLHRISTHHAGMDLPWHTKIGNGLALVHGWSLVVNSGAILGNNVTLFHGVTLGRRDRISSTGERISEFPIIEDEVWIGPHAIIVGGITIGRGSRIAGGAFVTDTIPPYSVVSGNPAVIVKSNCIPDVMNPVPL
jgi:serine O-acetyltransferase